MVYSLVPDEGGDSLLFFGNLGNQKISIDFSSTGIDVDVLTSDPEDNFSLPDKVTKVENNQ